MTSGFIIGFVFGALCIFAFLMPVHIRMCRRLVDNQQTEMKAEELEKRRYTSEFDNPDVPRPGAGPEGVERELFSVRLGALARARLGEKSSSNRLT